ncbi:uncharacterized protein LOC124434807 isoform X3 [Xenia sp. Carnegie-2017]|uniref:uncharacterized protein LOC124434807 isoform X3 n=1 Tax=Xenia sp. Carnegie-2017 TaxID=2897299 RepID=UPI001F03978C|nr:uncharacterized protein LOC124434807 isoform X3 [Xenia sp. Carnegie-2017]
MWRIKAQMDFEFSVWMVVIFTICLSKYGNGNELRIFRRERDIFTNIYYSSSQTDRDHSHDCMKYNAECHLITKCRFCECKEGTNTFIMDNNDKNNRGSCIKDEEVNLESDSDNDEFTLENTVTNKCLKQVGNSVWGTTCGNSLDQKWIRLKTNNEQLMNLKSLLCISRYGSVVEMSQCRYFEMRSQKLGCTYQTDLGATFTTTFIANFSDYLEQTTNGRRIFRSYTGQYWKTHQNKTEVNVCEKKTEYKGCYRLSDGNFMKYLKFNNNSRNVEKFSVSAPIYRQNKNCIVEEDFKYMKDGNKSYEDGSKNLFKLSSTGEATKEIEIRNMDALRQWNGSLLQIQIKCRNELFNIEERHCFLIKLQSLLPLEPEETPPPSISPSTSMTATGRKGVRETSKSDDYTPVIIAGIAVLVVLVISVIVVIFCLYRRRRKRAQSTSNRLEMGVVNFSKAIYEEPHRIYATVYEVSGKQTGEAADTYSYTDCRSISNRRTEVQGSRESTHHQSRNLPDNAQEVETDSTTQVKGNVFMTLTSLSLEEPYIYANDVSDVNTQSRTNEQPAGDSDDKHKVKTTKLRRPSTNQEANEDNYASLTKKSRDSSVSGNTKPELLDTTSYTDEYAIPNDVDHKTVANSTYMNTKANSSSEVSSQLVEVDVEGYAQLMKNRKSRDSNCHYYQQLQKTSMQVEGNTSEVPLFHGNEQIKLIGQPECVSDYVIPNDAGASMNSNQQLEVATSYTDEYVIPNDVDHKTVANSTYMNTKTNSSSEVSSQLVEVNVEGYAQLMKNRKNMDSNCHYYQQLQKTSMQVEGNTSEVVLSHGNEQIKVIGQPEYVSDYVIPNDAGASMNSNQQLEVATSYTDEYVIPNDVDHKTVANSTYMNTKVNSSSEVSSQLFEVDVEEYAQLMKNRKSRDSNCHYYQQLQKTSMQVEGNTSEVPLSHGNEQIKLIGQPECVSDYVIPNDAGASMNSNQQLEVATSYTGEYVDMTKSGNSAIFSDEQIHLK